jgi:hypothetical protein
MTVRTFKQCGQAIGTDPVSIIAKINGVVVFEGDILTLDIPLPDLPDQVTPDISFNNPIFSWESTVDFAGTANLEIVVAGTGTLIVTDTFANYVRVGNTGPSADIYGSFYSYTENGVIISDPFTNPTIDGAEVVRVRDFDPANPLDGQWWYTVDSESTFTATVNVAAGQLTATP